MVWIATSTYAADVVNFISRIYGTVVHLIYHSVHVCALVGRRVMRAPILLEVSCGEVWTVTKGNKASSF